VNVRIKRCDTVGNAYMVVAGRKKLAIGLTLHEAKAAKVKYKHERKTK